MTAFARPDRDARLEARLAAYTRYAATVAEQFSAALHGDAERAGAICAERELLGEHYAELCERAPAADVQPFGALLADAIVELDHHVGIELALRQRIAALRDARTNRLTQSRPAVDNLVVKFCGRPADTLDHGGNPS
jgi:hypothetical protein